jgi:1,4-dihydroxy-2-naphthoate octaprenyltransferase/chlorophyll synthase
VRSSRAAERWLQAAKPGSWPKLLTPFLLGQAIGSAHPSVSAFLFGLAFTVLDLLFIVFVNDWGDREVDAIKRRMFPRSSAKTIPDRVLPAWQVLAAGLLAGAGAIAIAFIAERALDRPGLGVAGLLAVSIFVAYTLPPIRLNYRGGGELLEMLGVGVVLPWMQAYLAGGELFAPRGLALLPGFAIASLASAIASGLSDERSDRRGGKRTFVTRFGNASARRASEALVSIGACAWAAAGMLTPLPFWIGAIPAAVAWWYAGAMLARSGSACTDAFAAQRRYKEALHHAIWRGALVASMLLVWWHLVLGGR